MAAEPETCDLLCLDLPKAERVRDGLPAADAIEALATGAKALGDPTRLVRTGLAPSGLVHSFGEWPAQTSR